MATRKLLGERVTIMTLPLTDQPTSREQPRARLLTPKGELAVLTDNLSPVMHLAYVQLLPGMPRGNHYHKLRHEQFYLISGSVELQLLDLSTGEQPSARMEPGDLAFIAPSVAHCFLPLAEGHALEFAPEPFDAADVYAQPVSAFERIAQ